MNSPDRLDFFFGNLLHLLTEAGVAKRRLSIDIGAPEDYIAEMLAHRTSPSLETVYAIAGALKVDVADLLRPGPQIAVSSGGSDNYWVERTAEQYLSSVLSKSREKAAHEPPTFDAVLNWWHSNDGLLTGLDSFEKYIELFERPDETEMKPKPSKIGPESLSSRELGRNDPELLSSIFDKSGPDIARSIAEAHLEVADGQPRLSVHTILVNLTSGNVVKLSYTRLLLPVKDGNGQTYIMNYSKPTRRSEIGREQVDQFEPSHGGEPVFAGLV